MNLKLSNLGVTTSSNAAQLASMGGSIGTVVTNSYISDLNGFNLKFAPEELDENTYPMIAYNNAHFGFDEEDNGNNFFLV